MQAPTGHHSLFISGSLSAPARKAYPVGCRTSLCGAAARPGLDFRPTHVSGAALDVSPAPASRMNRRPAGYPARRPCMLPTLGAGVVVLPSASLGVPAIRRSRSFLRERREGRPSRLETADAGGLSRFRRRGRPGPASRPHFRHAPVKRPSDRGGTAPVCERPAGTVMSAGSGNREDSESSSRRRHGPGAEVAIVFSSPRSAACGERMSRRDRRGAAAGCDTTREPREAECDHLPELFVAPHPALRATFSPLGEKDEYRPSPREGRRCPTGRMRALTVSRTASRYRQASTR